MTEENYIYRTSQALLRNQFPGKGKLKIPVIPKFQENPGDFDDLLLIGFDKTHPEDQNHLDRMVHFFLYDYRFDRDACGVRGPRVAHPFHPRLHAR